MSYTFNWDCKLPIKNIEDIVSINIVPETKTYDEGDYVSLRGQICIDGEYTSSTKEQFFFNECIPLDITLPNNGGRNDIKIEVDTFDYTIEDGNQLSLDLNLCLAGYDLDNTPTLVEPEEEIEVQEQPPVMFTKEAVITPKSDIQEDMDLIDDDELDYLDFDDVTMPSDDDDIQLVEEMIIPEEVAVPKPYLTQGARKETLTDKVDQILNEEPVLEVLEKETDEEMILSDDEDIQLVEEMSIPEEAAVPKPYLTQEARKETLTDKVNQILNKEAVVQEKKETVIPTPVKEVITEPIQEEIEVIIPQTTGWMEMIQEQPTKVHQTMSIPVVNKEFETTTTSNHLMSEPVNEVEVCVDEEEVLPYPLKESSQSVTQESAPIKEKSKIFDMLYGLEQEEINEQPQIHETHDEDIQLCDQVVICEEGDFSKPYLAQEDRKESLTDKIKQILNKEPVVQEKKETVTPTSAPVKEVITEPIQEEIEIITPQSTGWKEMIQENPTKVHQTMSIPVVKKESQTTTSTHLMSKSVNEVEDCLEEEEILTYPLKGSSPTKEKSNIFDMLYGLEQEEINEQPQIEEQNMVEEVPSEVQISAQPIVQQVQVEKPTLVQETKVEPTVLQKNLEEDEELKLQAPVMVSTSNDDSIASQFSDGESIIKIIFVQEEETTINDICTKYNITQESIYDCANIAAPLCPGDRVMINYGQYRRN